MSQAFIQVFLKFFVVGGFGFGLDMLTTWLLKERLKLRKYLANTIGYAIGILFRFFANKFWAFKNDNPQWIIQLLQFGAIALVGLPLVNGIIYLLNEKWKVLSFYKAKIVAMIVFMLWNFTANYFWTFNEN